MIKKKILTFSLCFLIIFKCIIPLVSANATTISDFGLDMLDYLTMESMSLALIEGAELDWSDLNLGDAALSAEEKARKIFAYYRQKAWSLGLTGVYAVGDMLSDYNVIDASTPAIGFQLGSGVSNEDLNDLQVQVSDHALGLSNSDYMYTISNRDLAYFNRYNTNYINDYLSNMNYVDDSSAQPQPDLDYYQYLDNINGSGFWFSSWANTNLNNSNIPGLVLFPPSTVTWFVPSQSSSIIPNSVAQWVYMVTTPIKSIYITSTGENTYSTTINIENSEFLKNFIGSNLNNLYNVGYPGTNGGFSFSGNQTRSTSYTFSGSLSAVLSSIQNKFRNVNIFVDGILWSQAGDLSLDKWNVSFPNAVIDNSTEDGKIVSAPIYWAVDENTGNVIDNFDVNLSKLLDMLTTKISSGATSVSIQDLVDADAIEKDGVAIGVGTGVISGVRSLADVIAKAKAEDLAGTITLDDVIAGEVPALPDLPPMGSNPGFYGVTVLAEIINFTNQSLPSDLIVVFWGVIFGAVILGIIKILHK